MRSQDNLKDNWCFLSVWQPFEKKIILTASCLTNYNLDRVAWAYMCTSYLNQLSRLWKTQTRNTSQVSWTSLKCSDRRCHACRKLHLRTERHILFQVRFLKRRLEFEILLLISIYCVAKHYCLYECSVKILLFSSPFGTYFKGKYHTLFTRNLRKTSISHQRICLI